MNKEMLKTSKTAKLNKSLLLEKKRRNQQKTKDNPQKNLHNHNMTTKQNPQNNELYCRIKQAKKSF